MKLDFKYIGKSSIQFCLYINILLLLKNAYIIGLDNIFIYYKTNISDILLQSIVGLIFGAFIGIRNNRRKNNY